MPVKWYYFAKRFNIDAFLWKNHLRSVNEKHHSGNFPQFISTAAAFPSCTFVSRMQLFGSFLKRLQRPLYNAKRPTCICPVYIVHTSSTETNYSSLTIFFCIFGKHQKDIQKLHPFVMLTMPYLYFYIHQKCDPHKLRNGYNDHSFPYEFDEHIINERFCWAALSFFFSSINSIVFVIYTH